MKTMLTKIALIVLLAVPLNLMAQEQSPIDKVFSKYAGQEKFTTVSIGKELFQMMMQMEMGDDPEKAKEMKAMMEQLESLKVISFEDSLNKTKAASLYNEFSALYPSSTYKELMSVKENGKDIRFVTKQDAGGKILELVMLMKEDSQATVLSLTGKIDLATVSKLSKGMKIDGMDKLQQMKEIHNTPKH